MLNHEVIFTVAHVGSLGNEFGKQYLPHLNSEDNKFDLYHVQHVILKIIYSDPLGISLAL